MPCFGNSWKPCLYLARKTKSKTNCELYNKFMRKVELLLVEIFSKSLLIEVIPIDYFSSN